MRHPLRTAAALLPLIAGAVGCGHLPLGRPAGKPPATRTTPPTRLPDVTWKPSWSEDFSGVGRPAALWTARIGGAGWGHHSLQYFTPENAALDGKGDLVITARKDGAGKTCWYGPCEYTSARISTGDAFTQRYGRFTARIKLPAGKGVWPAFWLNGRESSDTSDPSYAEIDVIETNGRPNLLHAATHGKGHHINPTATIPGTYTDGFHVYGVDWTPTEITFWMDGKPYGRVDKYPGWPFDRPLALILDLQIGGNWPGPPDASTPFPVRMLVDWVRVYRAGDS